MRAKFCIGENIKEGEPGPSRIGESSHRSISQWFAGQLGQAHGSNEDKKDRKGKGKITNWLQGHTTGEETDIPSFHKTLPSEDRGSPPGRLSSTFNSQGFDERPITSIASQVDTSDTNTAHNFPIPGDAGQPEGAWGSSVEMQGQQQPSSDVGSGAQGQSEVQSEGYPGGQRGAISGESIATVLVVPGALSGESTATVPAEPEERRLSYEGQTDPPEMFGHEGPQ